MLFLVIVEKTLRIQPLQKMEILVLVLHYQSFSRSDFHNGFQCWCSGCPIIVNKLHRCTETQS